MKLPSEVAVMTLPNATLFPQALLPLYIFEARYRRMLVDALNSSRMFSVAMQKPGAKRESPLTVAGLGLIRVAVGHTDGSSHLILQGIARVELAETVSYKPYRIQRIRPMRETVSDEFMVEALLATLRELLEERVKLGLPFPFPVLSKGPHASPPPGISPKEVLEYLDKLVDPEQVADLVSCAVLPGALERQSILETESLEERLKQLVRFLRAEIRRHREAKQTPKKKRDKEK